MIKIIITLATNKKGILYYTVEPRHDHVHPLEHELSMLLADAFRDTVQKFSQKQAKATYVEDAPQEIMDILIRRQQAAIEEQRRTPKKKDPNA